MDWFRDGVAYVDALDIPEVDKMLIRSGNAKRLLKLA
jgi:hypothetical protein